MSDPTPARPAPRRWRSVITIAVSRTIDDTESGLMNSLFPVIRASLGLSLAQLGLMAAIPRFARMIFGPLWSMIADRWGRKRVLVFATGVWGIWTGLVGLAQNFEQLLVLYAIGAIGTVAGEPIANGLVADHFKNNERGRAYGWLRSLSSFGSLAMTPLIAQFARSPEGWRYGLYTMGALSVASGIAIALLVDDPAPASGKSGPGEKATRPRFGWRDIAELWRIPTFRLLAGSVLFITSIVMMPFMVSFFVDVRGWETADANFLQGAFTAGWMVSSVLGGFLGDWFERRFGARGRVILMQIYLAAFSIASLLVFQVDWGRGPLAFVVLLCFGLIGSVGFSGVVLPMVSHVVPGVARATAFALLFSLLQGMFAGILSLSAGALADRIGLQGLMLWVVTVPYAINAVYWTLLHRSYPEDRARRETLDAAKA
ncbi:MAG: MFS transporter [Opitutaceae bacterium]|jgi:MFS family permease|nr:MFS transporter [Opitutaceae bacterium]